MPVPFIIINGCPFLPLMQRHTQSLDSCAQTGQTRICDLLTGGMRCSPLKGCTESPSKVICGLSMPATRIAGLANSPAFSRSSSPPLLLHLRPRWFQRFLRARGVPAPMLRWGGFVKRLGILSAPARFCSATSLSGMRPVTCGCSDSPWCFVCGELQHFGVELSFRSRPIRLVISHQLPKRSYPTSNTVGHKHSQPLP